MIICMKWLFKSDPETYSWQDLVRDKKTMWDGVANPLALKHMRSVKKGDSILIYHTGVEKSVVGIAEAASDSYTDPAVVDIKAVKPLHRPVSLAEIKANPKLKSWELVRMPRLSVMPVTEEAWREVLRISQ